MVCKQTIVIVDDHPLFREGLKSIIGRDTKFEVVGEAGHALGALRIIRKLKPDLVLVDMRLPDKNGIELARDIKRLFPEMYIMMVTMHAKVDYIVKAFQAGATGYVVKESATERLMEGIEAVLKGEYFMDSAVSHKVVKKLIESPHKEARFTNTAYETLTAREQEVMALLAEGLSTKATAEKLFISPKTAENHRSSIMRKLDLHSTVELVRYAARIGIIDVDLWIN